MLTLSSMYTCMHGPWELVQRSALVTPVNLRGCNTTVFMMVSVWQKAAFLQGAGLSEMGIHLPPQDLGIIDRKVSKLQFGVSQRAASLKRKSVGWGFSIHKILYPVPSIVPLMGWCVPGIQALLR